MSSMVRAESLRRWLVEVMQIRTENFSLAIEFGTVSAEFIELATVEVEPPLDNGELIHAGQPIENYIMEDKYQLSLVLRNQLPEQFQDIKLKLLLWLSTQCQKVEVSYDAEKNNQDTYDYFFDLNITEHSHHGEAGMKTC